MAGTVTAHRALGAGRVFIAELDSQAQAAAFRDVDGVRLADPRPAILMLTERLRVGATIAGTVLVTDAMVLDGEYFLTLGPGGVLRELGMSTADLPLEITGLDASFADALERRRTTGDHAWAVADGAVSDDWTPSVHIEQAWRDWVAAAEMGLIRYTRQPSAVAEMRFGTEPVIDAASAAQLERLRIEKYRSAAHRILDELESTSPGDAAATRKWWSDAYLRMIAENAAASWLSFGGSVAAPLEEREGSVTLRVPLRLATWAQRATPAEFAAGRAAAGDLREKLQSGPSGLQLRALTFIATAEMERPSRARIVAEAVARIIVAAMLVVIALPFVPLFAADGPLAWCVFAIIVVGTFPFAAFAAVFRVFVPERTAVLVVHPSQAVS